MAEQSVESALARPQHFWSYECDADPAQLAGEYAFGLAMNHAFVGVDKRIGFVGANVF